MKAFITGALALALMFAPAVLAQHQHGSGHNMVGRNGGERHVEHGHGRNEGRVINTKYRVEHFGYDHSMRLYDVLYGRPTFLFGGVWFGISEWPSEWLDADYVYVVYVDGDYFLVNERFPDVRIAIVME